MQFRCIKNWKNVTQFSSQRVNYQIVIFAKFCTFTNLVKFIYPADYVATFMLRSLCTICFFIGNLRLTLVISMWNCVIRLPLGDTFDTFVIVASKMQPFLKCRTGQTHRWPFATIHSYHRSYTKLHTKAIYLSVALVEINNS